MRSSVNNHLAHSTFNPEMAEQSNVKELNVSHIGQNQSNIKPKNHKSKTQIFKQCQTVLRKTAQIRTPADNQALLSLIEHNQFLSDMTNHVGLQCYKGLMKNAKIQQVRAKQIIRNQHDPITHIVIVLDGKLGICKQQDDFKIPQLQKSQKIPASKQTKTIVSMENLFDELTALSCRQIQIVRKKNLSFKRKSSMPLSAGMFMPPPCTNQEFQSLQIQSNINANEEYGSKLRCSKKVHPNALVTMEKSLLLTFQFSFIVYWFEAAFRAKLGKTIQMMKRLSAFSFLEDGKLAQIILYLRKQKRRRNQPIYRQGQRTQYLFLLIDGQIKFSKQANLFIQNPNQLYMDRRKLTKFNSQQKKSQKNQKVQEDILPYANLSTLYNYRPVKKNIDLGLTSSVADNLCFFGAEQVISKKNREATAIVSSFDAEYYLIEVKKLDELLGSKFIQQFYQLLEQSLRKTILYRQSQFAQKINFQNTQNLDYFYYEGNKVKDSPRKYRLQKINGLFSQQKKQPNIFQSQTKMQPFYTTFNFHKLIKGESNHTRNLSERNSKEKIKSNRPQTAMDSSHESLKVKYNAAQQRLISMSHSWKPIKMKVGQQMKVSKKISQKKHQINLFQPLIDQQYFAFVQKEQKRINRQHKIFKLSLGKRTK